MLCIGLLSLGRGAHAQNLLVNPGFEALPILGPGQSDVGPGGAKWITTTPGGNAYEGSVSGLVGWAVTLDGPAYIHTDIGPSRRRSAEGFRSIFSNRWESRIHQAPVNLAPAAQYRARLAVGAFGPRKAGRLQLVAGALDQNGNPTTGSTIIAQRTFGTADWTGFVPDVTVPASGWVSVQLDYTAPQSGPLVGLPLVFAMQIAGGCVGSMEFDDAFLSETLPPCDLVPTTFATGDERRAGEFIHVAWSVANQGVGVARGPWVDQVMISAVGPLDQGVPAGPAIASPTTLDPETSYQRSQSIQLPNVPGSYWLRVVTDAAGEGGVSEANEANNSSLPTEIVVFTPRPDLVTQDAAVVGIARVGEPIAVTWTARNVGTAPAAGTWVDRLYLSQDASWDTSDHEVGNGFSRSGPLQVGGVYQPTQSPTLMGVLPGRYWLIVRNDSANALSEGDGEANNTFVGPVPVEVLPALLPDLRVTNITPPANAIPGSTVEIAYTVANFGAGPASGSWDESAYASSDSQLGNDTLASTRRFSGSIPPGQSVQRRYSITVPTLPPGDYWLGICIDTRSPGEIEETEEGNNCGIVPVCLNCNTPNLVVSSITAPTSAVAGQSVQVSWTIANTGAGDAIGSWMDRILLKTTCSDVNPVVIGEFRRNTGVISSGSYSLTRSVTVPAEVEGDRFISIVTDAYNELPEPGTEGDNVGCASQRTAVTLPPGPDLRVTSVQLPSSTGVFNTPFIVRWTVRNFGNQPADIPWADRVFLSRNPIRDGDDFPLEPVRPAPNSLEPDAEYTVEHTVQLPLRATLSPGTYYLIVATDSTNAVSEQRESNQWAVSQAAEIARPPLPDLRIVSISTPTPACPGQPVDVVYTIVNAGNAPAEGTWIERLLSSPDNAIGNDYFGSEQHITSPLAPGETVTRQGRVTVPNEGLSYRTVVCLDPNGQVFESDKANNCSIGLAPATVGRPDLRPVNISPAVSNAFADGELAVTWGAANQGLCATPSSFLDSVYLVDLADGSSHLLGSLPQPTAVQPSQTVPRSATFTIPGRIAGQFRVQVSSDSASNVLESDEANNSAISESVVTIAQPPRADLVIFPGSIEVPADGLVSSSGTVRYVVMNMGGANAQSPWSDRIVAKLNGTGPEVEVGSRNWNQSLDFGELLNVEAPITLPTQPGSYTICVTVDSGDRVNEGLDGGESNNRDCSVDSFITDGYRVVVSPSISEGQAGTPVSVTGYAERLSDGQRVGEGVPVRIRHRVRGFDRTLSLNTNANGEFGVPSPAPLQLLPTEAGRYVITSGPPGAIAPTPEVPFVLHGLRATPTYTGLRVAPGMKVATGQLELFNAGDVTLTDLRFEPENLPTGVVLDLRLNSQPLGGQSIVGQQVVRPTFSLSAPEGTPNFEGTFTLRWTTAQGATAATSMSLRVAPRDPALTSNPTSLSGGMITSTNESPRQSVIEFSIQNAGGLPTGPITVELPANTRWMTLSSPAQLPSLNPDDESRVVLTLAPTPSDPLGDYTGQLVLRFDGGTRTKAVTYRFTHRSDAVGSLEVAAADEQTYWAPDRPPLAGTLVTVKDARTNQIMGTQTTSESGAVRFDDLPEGAYYVEAERDRHLPFRTLASVNRSGATPVSAFLPYQTVTYSWNVDPIQVEDRYRFVLGATFVTNVYKPVLDIVVIDPATGQESRVIDFDDIGSSAQRLLRITNRGLVDAPSVTLRFGNTSAWTLDPLVRELGTIAPGATNAVTVPMTISRVGRGNNSCELPYLEGCTALPCGQVTSTECSGVPCRWVNVCTGPGGYLPPPGSSGSGSGESGGVAHSNTPTFQCNRVCDCGSLPVRNERILRCVGSGPVVVTAPCAAELEWEVDGGPYSLSGTCLPSVSLPDSEPRQYFARAYCICADGRRLAATYEVVFVRVRIRDDESGSHVSPTQAIRRWVGEVVDFSIVVEPSSIQVVSCRWSVPGQPIASYNPNATASSGPEYLLPSALGQVDLPRFTYATRDTRDVGVDVVLTNGSYFVNCGSVVQLQYDAVPSLSFGFRLPHSTVLLLNEGDSCWDLLGSGRAPNVDGELLLLGLTPITCLPGSSGVNYDWNEPSLPAGRARPLQVIRFSSARYTDSSGQAHSIEVSSKRDAGFPFRDAPTDGVVDRGDDPSIALLNTWVAASFEADMATWLLWQSDRPGSLWVPCTVANWGWNMSASRSSTVDSWVAGSLVPNAEGEFRPVGDIYGQFPEWNGVR